MMASNGMPLKNRLVRSATYEHMAAEDGKATDQLINFYSKLAKGGVGLIILGATYVPQNGHGLPFGIDAIEISGGTIVDTVFMMSRGDIPIDMITGGAEPAAKEQMEGFLYSIKDMVKYEEAYWLKHAEKIKESIGDVPLILVGGLKYPQTMAKILEENKADLISLCRSLIREPDFSKEMAEGRKDPSKCRAGAWYQSKGSKGR